MPTSLRIDDMKQAGLHITGTTQPRAAGFLSGLKTNVLIGMRPEVADLAGIAEHGPGGQTVGNS